MPYSTFAGLTPVIPPVAAPISIADVKAHSRIYIDLQDSLIAGYISSAAIACEDRTKRAFMPQTWRLALEQWPGRTPMVGYREVSNFLEYWKWNHIDIPKPPLTSIVSFTYTDTQGNVGVMAQSGFGNQIGNYLLDLETEPGRIVLPFAGIWPTTILLPGSPIKITYTCGYPAYAGNLQVDESGNATWLSGDQFDPLMTGTWINIGGQSLNVQSVTSPTQLQLSAGVFPIDASIPFTANAVPQPLRSAILFLVAHFYENREPIITGRGEVAIEIPDTIDALLAPYKIYRS